MEDKALNRLLKKLSAVRATLNQDERDLLDGIIASARFGVGEVETEVTPHAIEMKNVEKVVSRQEEVAAHQLELKNVEKVASRQEEVFAHKLENKAMERAEQKFTEVKLHALETKAIEKVQAKAAEVIAHAQEMKGPGARIFRIQLDKEAATYRVV